MVLCQLSNYAQSLMLDYSQFMSINFNNLLKLILLIIISALILFTLRSCKKTEFTIIEDGDFLIVPIANKLAIKSVRRPVAVGVYDENRNITFVSYMGEKSNPFVQSFNHSNSTWSKAKRVADITKSKYYKNIDRHDYPSLLELNNGRLAVFYAVHAKELRLSISAHAASSKGRWKDGVVKEAAFAAYPMPLKTQNGDIYVFYRESSFSLHPGLDRDDRPLQYIVSTDNAKSWQRSSDISSEEIALGSWHRADNLDEIYVGQIRYQPASGNANERFHIAWTLSGGGFEGPKHDRYHKDVYYAYFLPGNKHFYSAGDRDLGLSISADEMKYCLVFDSGALDAANPKTVGYSLLLSWVNDSKPLLVYEINKNEHIWLGSSTWDGSTWQHSSIPSGNSIMDLEKLDEDSFALYLGNGKIYSSHDAGKTWNYATTLKLPDSKKIAKLALIDNYKDPARLIVSENINDDKAKRDVFLVGFAR